MLGQVELGLETNKEGEQIYEQGYLYRATASNQEDWNDHRVVHLYNQRGIQRKSDQRT
jgi:hypothetical protein